MAKCILIWLIDFIKYILFSQSSESWRSMHWTTLKLNALWKGLRHHSLKNELTVIINSPSRCSKSFALVYLWNTHQDHLNESWEVSVLPGNKKLSIMGLNNMRLSKQWQNFWVNCLFKLFLCEYNFILWISIRLHIYVSYHVDIFILAYSEPIQKCHQPMSLKTFPL